jgi:hypothetical protein
MKHGGLLLQPAHLERTPKQRIVDVQGGSHLHHYAILIQIEQLPLCAIVAPSSPSMSASTPDSLRRFALLGRG